MSTKLSKLQVTNFRNLDPEVLSFAENINCIFGQNGNGKTNLLEAIYFLANRKSFRKKTSFPQLLSVESEKPQIIFSSILTTKENKITYSGTVTKDEGRWFKDNRPVRTKPGLNTVFLNPFDSYSFHNVPSFRREWFDDAISLLSKGYKANLAKYTKALRFRNKLLSQTSSSISEQVKAIDEQLSQSAYEVLKERTAFLQEMRPFCNQIFKEIFHESHDLSIEIESKLQGLSPEQIYQMYRENFEKDVIMRKTGRGIHRDNYVFFFDGFNSFEYCSLGQQKMSFLSLIFAYIELFRYKFSSYPIVLIDDVSGELDSQRWKNLIEYVKGKSFQIFITTANKNFKEELEKIDNSKKFFIDNGMINQK